MASAAERNRGGKLMDWFDPWFLFISAIIVIIGILVLAVEVAQRRYNRRLEHSGCSKCEIKRSCSLKHRRNKFCDKVD